MPPAAPLLLAGLAALLVSPLGLVDPSQQGSTTESWPAYVPDPPGDPVVAGTSQRPPSGTYDAVDILGAWAGNESERALELGVRMRALPGQQPTEQGFSVRVRVYFSYDGARYQVAIGASSPCPAFLLTWRASTNTYAVVTCVPVRLEPPSGSIHVSLNRSSLVNETGSPFQPGKALHGWHVFANATYVQTGGSTVAVIDRAPDSGFGPTILSRFAADGHAGHLKAFSPEPVRMSNGESTTLAYAIEVRNDGATEDLVEIGYTNTASEWTVRVPAALRIPARGEARFPVILTANFTHEHGATQFFSVHISSTKATAAVTVRLGVHWLESPQLAGHHNRLWIHAAQSSDPVPLANPTWMNPLERDPAADAESFPLSPSGFGAQAPYTSARALTPMEAPY